MFLMTGHSHSRYIWSDKTYFVPVNRGDRMRVTVAGKVEPVNTKQAQRQEQSADTAGREAYTHIRKCNNRGLSVSEYVLTNWPLLWWIAGNVLSNHSSLDVKIMAELWRKKNTTLGHYLYQHHIREHSIMITRPQKKECDTKTSVDKHKSKWINASCLAAPIGYFSKIKLFFKLQWFH